MSTSRLLVGVTSVVTLAAAPCFAQSTAPPTLTSAQRSALEALVRAVDANAPALSVDDLDWPLHLLRASDGSHYVAFSIAAADAVPAHTPLALYVRLATRFEVPPTAPERSAVAEWLSGKTPRPVLARRGIAFGEMPTYGAGSAASRGPSPDSQTLQLLALERERAREKREAQDRARRAALEGTGTGGGPRPLLPFEDFDVHARTASAGGRPVIQRSLTAGPGDYELTVAWVDPGGQPLASGIRLARRRLTLPPAPATTLALSSVILADDVRVRETPVPASEQSGHPYSIGPTEIVPARDSALTTDERLALIVQVINARGSAAGKPDVAVGFRMLRKSGAVEEMVGTLAPQVYNETTLPADFDIGKGHPIFAAVAVPLDNFRRGEYRLEVAADDRVAGVSTRADTTFTVIATPAALLREAPALALPFERDDLLQPRIISEITARLRPRSPSVAMLGALAIARERKFVELVRGDAVEPDEVGARSALRVLALYALGDTPAVLTAPLRVAEQQSASPAAVQIIAGGLRALEGNDREALAAWDTAIGAGADAAVVAPLIIDARLRLGEADQAVTAARQTMSGSAHDAPLARRAAAAQIVANQHAEALQTLDAVLEQNPADIEAQWLSLHALFGGFVAGTPPGSDAASRSRFVALATRYISANGRHATLARDWVLAMENAAQMPAPPKR